MLVRRMGSVPLRINDHIYIMSILVFIYMVYWQFWCFTSSVLSCVNFGVYFIVCQFWCLFLYITHTRRIINDDGEGWVLCNINSHRSGLTIWIYRIDMPSVPIISKDGSEDSARAYFRVCASVAFQNFPLSTVVVYRSRYSS